MASAATSPVLTAPALQLPNQTLKARRRSFVQTLAEPLKLSIVPTAPSFMKAPSSPISLNFMRAPRSPSLSPNSPIKLKFDQALTVGKSLFTRSKSMDNIKSAALAGYFDDVDGCFIVSMKGREGVGVYSTVYTDNGPKLSIYMPQDSLQDTAKKLKLVHAGKHNMVHLRISKSDQVYKDRSCRMTQVECINPWMLQDERRHMCVAVTESHQWGGGYFGFSSYLDNPSNTARTILTCPGVAFGVLISRTGAEWRKDAGHKHAVDECLSLPIEHMTRYGTFVSFESTTAFGQMNLRKNKGETVDVWVHPDALRLFIA